MSQELSSLDKLLRDFSDLNDHDIEAEGEELYFDLFISPSRHTGQIVAADGETIFFHADRYHHAFHTSEDRARLAYSKAKVARDRIERIGWIRPILEGHVPNIECWEVPVSSHRPFPGKRAYVSWSHAYIIWLEPRRNGGFKFSSAYVTNRADLSRVLKNGRKVNLP